MAGSAKIDDRVWQALRHKLYVLDSISAKIGVLRAEGALPKQRRDGKPPDATVVEIAVIHEFGAPKANIPERSFIRRTFRTKRRKLEKLAARLAEMIVVQEITPKTAIEVLGLWGSNAVKATIKNGPHIPPPLHPYTIAKKKSSRPLVDTGQLANSITHELVKEKV